MTVKQLISRLKDLDQNARILDDDGDDVEWDIELWDEKAPDGETVVRMRTNHG